MSHPLDLRDVPGYRAHFPVLKGKQLIGCGLYSRVYEGTRPDTVLKLSVDPTFRDFIHKKQGVVGLPALIHDYGSMNYGSCSELYLVELNRLKPLHRWDHIQLKLERDALRNAIEYRIDRIETFLPMAPCQHLHALGLLELARSGLFSEAAQSALKAIAEYMDETKFDLILDLFNPDNYMTNGSHLVITDPFQLVT